MFNKGRWIAAFLSVSMIMSMAPVSALAAQEVATEEEVQEAVVGEEAKEDTSDAKSDNDSEDNQEENNDSESIDSAEQDDNSGNALPSDDENSKNDTAESLRDAADENDAEDMGDLNPDESDSVEDGSDAANGEAGAKDNAEEQQDLQTTEVPVAEVVEQFPGYEEEYSLDTDNSDELFEEYARRLFYGERPKLRKSMSTGERLTGQNRAIYDRIKQVIPQIASGDQPSALITVSFEELGLKADGVYYAEDLGLEYIYDGNSWNSGLRDAAYGLFVHDQKLIMECLFADCPYEMYWASGIGTSFPGYSSSASYNPSTGEWEGKIVFDPTEITMRIKVQPDYRVDGSSDEYTVDTVKTGLASSAASYSQTIVQEAANNCSTDYEKIVYYKETICDLVSYNHDAAGHSSTYADRDPWALIYVFDQDPTTNVVCEGYSEAFQYLCNQTDFNDDSVCAYSVTGTMYEPGESGENHKWNIVHMDDGYNYIADITNSDDAWGRNGELFLNGFYGGDVEEGYRFKHSTSDTYLCYSYDNETLRIFTKSELTLSPHKYGESEPINVDEVADMNKISLVLTDKIGMRIHVTIDDFFVDDYDYIQFEHNGEVVQQLVKDAVSKNDLGDDFYEVIFELPLTTTQMTDDITFKMVVSDKEGTPATYSVQSYAEQMLNDTESTFSGEELALASALLHYGSFAQTYINYNVENLPDQDIDGFEWDDDIDMSALSNFEHTVYLNDADNGFGFQYVTLLLGSDVSLRYYFDMADGYDVSDFNIVILDQYNNSVNYTIGFNESKNLHYIMIPNIKAIDLGNMYMLRVTTPAARLVELNYGPLSFCYSKLNNPNGSAKAKDLCKALYKYCEAVHDCVYGADPVN